LYISVYHCLLVTGDLERAAQIAEAWTQAYPRDARSWVNLGYVYRLLGRNDEALAAVLGGVRLNPAAVPDYPTPILVYIRQGRLDRAVATIREFEARKPGFSSAWFLYQVAFLRHDEAGMAQQAKRLGPYWFALEASTAAYTGQLARSRDLTQRDIASAKQVHASEDVAVLEARSALTEALYGNPAEARSAAMQAVRPSASWDAQSNGALALALAGEAAQAQKVAADLNRRFPEGTFVQFYYLPAIRAALALDQRKPERAIESLRAVASYEIAMNDSVSAVGSPMIPAYIRGEAFLSLHQGAQASTEFQKILDYPGFVGIFPTGALAHLALGRAYALQGDTARAKTAYQDFLALWKDADPNIPILKQAKAEYAKLQ
jgi:eukaryotic-like serine/threonine-protein kinase